MKKWMKPVVPVVAVAVAATAFFARGRGPAVADSTVPEYQTAERRSLEVTAEASGQIEPIRLVEVKSKASGEILRMIVESGDQVRRGDLLAEVDPRDVRNAFEQAEADLGVADARAQTAERQRQRSTELREANVITEQEFESAMFEEANARAQLVKAKTNLELARERLNDVTIRAPIDGVIIRKDVEEGQIIQSASQNISGGTTLLVMADLSEMQVRTLVNETELGQIQPGMPARVNVEAFPGRPFIGTVTKIEPQAVVEQNVTMFPVLVHMENREGLLRPGMNAEVIVEVARREDVVTIPNAAVVAPRDIAAAAALFGLSEESVRGAMRGGFGGGAPGGDAAQPGSGAAAPGPQQGGAPQPGGQQNMGRGGMQGMGGPGGPGSGRAGGAARRGIGNGDMRSGLVFIQTDSGIEPRPVLLGVNDWDHTEVLRGVEPGDRVVLISVARLQQQQQEMLDRMRQRNSGPIPGAGQGGMPRR